MARKRNKFADYVAYLAVRYVATLAHVFGCHASYQAARWIADMLFRFDRRHRTIATEHLLRSFPNWPSERLRRVARESFRSMAYMGMEMLFITRVIRPETWRRHVVLTNQAQNIRLLTQRNRGIVYVVGHFGNWEIVGYTTAILGFEGFAVARPLDNPYLNRYVMLLRQKKGLTILDKRGASLRMDGIFHSRRYVGFIADQDAGRTGVFVNFFGRQASTAKAPALMAMRYEVPVVVGYGRRLSERFNFELGIQRIIHPQEWADKPDPLRWLTQEYTTELEKVARRWPEQYLWAHRRWKHRPPGQARPADGIA
jgi:KDO2-lipid IV(A) lauroyltransferase